MAESLGPEAAARHCISLGRALAALRLNKHYPPWRAVADHLDAVSILPPGEQLALSEGGGWPASSEWLRARVDPGLAPGLIPTFAALADAGDLPARARLAYLQTMAAARPLFPRGLQVSLVHQEEERATFELVLDRLDLAQLHLVRWTLRVEDSPGPRLGGDAFVATATARFEDRLRRLGTEAALPAFLSLSDELRVLGLVRGEIGPARAGTAGPWVSAALSRIERGLRRTTIDDPLLEEIEIPSPDADFGMSHLRKWAVPSADLPILEQLLSARGSRNLTSTYALP